MQTRRLLVFYEKVVRPMKLTADSWCSLSICTLTCQQREPMLSYFQQVLFFFLGMNYDVNSFVL